MNIAEVKNGVLCLSAIPGTEVCDFCSGGTVAKAYECPTFTIDFSVCGVAAKHTSNGGWSACAECAKLIDSGDLAGLSQRSFEKYGEGPKDEEMREFLQRLHGEFWRLKK